LLERHLPRSGPVGVPATTTSPAAAGSAHRLATLFGLLYFLQGIGEPTEGLIAQPVCALLKSWHDSPAQITAFAALLSLPWTIKPLYGLLTDFLPLGGYRRKAYLVLSSLAALVGFAGLSFWPLPEGDHAWLMLLLLPTVGVAFGDVVVDALMVEHGQSRGLTGRLQSVQWAAIYAASIFTGIAGGYLSGHQLYQTSFALCAIVAVLMVVLSLTSVEEPPSPSRAAPFRHALGSLWQGLRSPVILSVCLLIFLFEFNPFSATVQNMYMTEHLGFSEQFYGLTRSMVAVSSIAACVGYGFYCRRVPMRWLVHLSIAMGVVATLAFWFLWNSQLACVVALASGFAYTTAMLVQLDLAAQACPPAAAGTIFAAIMALSNASSSLSTYLGGKLFEQGIDLWGHTVSFNVLVGIGALTTAACWLVVPLLPKRLVP
jgi:MFS family permease